MSDIFLNQAYQACLWLAERELDVPDEDRQGVWDLSDKRELKLDRKAIIEELGEGYFHDSLYHLRNLDLIDFSNSIDGPLKLDYGELIEESRFVTGGPRAVTGADYLEGNLTSEIDKLIYNNAIETSHLEQEGIVQRDQQQEKEQKETNTSKPTKHDIAPDAAEMMAEIMGGVQVLADQIAAAEKDAQEEYQEETQLHIQAQIKAHHMLVDLLASKTAKASGYEVVTSHIFDCLKQKRELETESILSSDFWLDHPLPHYEYSMLHFGPGQNAYFQKQCDRKGIKFEPEIIKGKEYWLTNIRLDQGFEEWYLPKLIKAFPLPTKAILKPQAQGKKYLIKFGTDSLREVKANDGLKYIRQVIKLATAKSPDAQIGFTPEIMNTIEAFDDIEKEQKEDFMGDYEPEVSQLSQDKKQRKLAQLLFHQLKLYMAMKFSEEALGTKYSLEDTEQLLKKKANAIRSKYPEDGESYYQAVRCALNAESKDELPDEDDLHVIFARNISQEEKELNNYQRKMQDNLKKLKHICPHFCYHMGLVHKGQKQGLIYTGTSFIYYPGGQIEWDLG